ncbi:hypothetical protein JNW91_06520 [Micromonospora sp. STR1_7]|uniref:Flavin reductase n=1 Tax=Micromonospora parastrephiae TaxID=2806101 RepID=A0ABS1XQK2_9ACTN|nr:hypothetical protein [Micromonospora parastrephiae]
MTTTHQPVSPLWSCGCCGADWPCEPGRRELLAEYDGCRLSLTVYLAAQLVVATQHLACVPAGHLHHRFLGWVR